MSLFEFSKYFKRDVNCPQSCLTNISRLRDIKAKESYALNFSNLEWTSKISILAIFDGFLNQQPYSENEQSSKKSKATKKSQWGKRQKSRFLSCKIGKTTLVHSNFCVTTFKYFPFVHMQYFSLLYAQSVTCLCAIFLAYILPSVVFASFSLNALYRVVCSNPWIA